MSASNLLLITLLSVLCLVSAASPRHMNGAKWDRRFQNVNGATHFLGQLLDSITNVTIPGFAVTEGVEELRIFRFDYERGVALPFSKVTYDPQAGSVALGYSKTALQLQYSFWWEYNWLIFTFSGLGHVTLEAMDARYEMKFSVDDIVIPQLICVWNYPDFFLHNSFASLLGVDTSVKSLFTSQKGWPDHARVYFNSTLATYLTAVLKKQYSALTFTVAGFDPEVNFSHPLATPQVYDSFLSLNYHTDNDGEDLLDKKKGLPAADLADLFTFGYNILAEAMERIMDTLAGGGRNITIKDGDLPEDMVTRLDSKSFSQVLPDINVEGTQGNLTQIVFVVSSLGGKLGVAIDNETSVATLSGLKIAAEFRDSSSSALLSAELSFSLNILLRPQSCLNSKAAVLKGELLSAHTVQVLSTKSDRFESIVTEGLEHWAGMFLEEYLVGRFGDKVFGGGIVLYQTELLKDCQFAFDEDGIVLNINE